MVFSFSSKLIVGEKIGPEPAAEIMDVDGFGHDGGFGYGDDGGFGYGDDGGFNDDDSIDGEYYQPLILLTIGRI
jgi:hypothetical protein